MEIILCFMFVMLAIVNLITLNKGGGAVSIAGIILCIWVAVGYYVLAMAG